MARVIKNVQISWDWNDPNNPALIRGFNVALTEYGGDPNDDAIVQQFVAASSTKSYTFKEIVLNTSNNYTAWVQAVYVGGDSGWVSQGNASVSDDGTATIASKSQLDVADAKAQQGVDDAAAAQSAANTAIEIATHPVNIPNGNFEDGLTGWIDDSGDVTSAPSTTTKFTGSKSVEIINSDSADASNSGYHGIHLAEVHSPIPSHDYKLRVRTRADNATANATVRLVVQEFDKSGVSLQTTIEEITGVNDGWETIETDIFTSHANAAYWKVSLQTLGSTVSGDSVYFDVCEYIDVSESSAAMDQINAISSDSELTKSEKLSLRREKTQILNEYSELSTEASGYGISYTSYTNAKDDLIGYLNNTADISTDITTTIDRTVFDTKFSTYYSERDSLQSLINAEVQATAETNAAADVTSRGLDNAGNFTGSIDGDAAADVKDGASRARTGLDPTTGAVTVLVPMDKSVPNIPAIDTTTGKIDRTVTDKDGNTLESAAGAQSKANTAESNAKTEITNRGLDGTGDFTGTVGGETTANIKDGAARARTGLDQTTGAVIVNVPLDKAAANIPALDTTSGKIDRTVADKDGNTLETETGASSKASTAETNAKGHADTVASTAETNAKNYSDTPNRLTVPDPTNVSLVSIS